MYRALGLQVVPAHKPAPKPAQWKRPAIKEWKQFQEELIPFSLFDKWYGEGEMFARHHNMGMITGRASNNVFVLDLDTYKSDAPQKWWEAQCYLNNGGEIPHSWRSRTGSGGRHLFFRAPETWVVPNNNTAIGVDIKGQGGFVVLPPSLHTDGSYAWEPGFAPYEVGELEEAPRWLLDALDNLAEAYGGHQPETRVQDGEPVLATPSPTSDLNAFGIRVDGRESAMARVVYAGVMALRREHASPTGAEIEQHRQLTFSHYLQETVTRLPGVDNAAGLEREGRGETLFNAKWRRLLGKWGTSELEAAAARPNPKGIKDVSPWAGEAAQSELSSPISPTLYAFPHPSTIPPREFLYGKRVVRRFLGATVSPGGLGKSSLIIVEALALATGLPLLGIQPHGPCRVWLWNGEDPADELDRRIAAAMQAHALTSELVGNRLYVDSGRDQEIIIAHRIAGQIQVAEPVVAGLIAAVQTLKIDVLKIDPFVSSHRVSENSNDEMDRVVKQWNFIADKGNCAVELVHHTRKTGGMEVGVEDARGASALIAAARTARVLNGMTRDEARAVNLEDERTRYFRVDTGKSNLAPRSDLADWYKIDSVDIGNATGLRPSDHVGVVHAFVMPDVFAAATPDQSLAALEAIEAGIDGGQHLGEPWRWGRGCPTGPLHAINPVMRVMKLGTAEEAKRMIRQWLTMKQLREETFYSKVDRKDRNVLVRRH